MNFDILWLSPNHLVLTIDGKNQYFMSDTEAKELAKSLTELSDKIKIGMIM